MKYNNNVREMDYMSQVAVKIINVVKLVAYTVWSRKRGAGREIINKLYDFLKTERVKTKRLVTFIINTMATHFHISNGAKQIAINDTSQNFEYKL